MEPEQHPTPSKANPKQPAAEPDLEQLVEEEIEEEEGSFDDEAKPPPYTRRRKS